MLEAQQGSTQLLPETVVSPLPQARFTALEALLDGIEDSFEAGYPAAGVIRALTDGLRQVRDSVSTKGWLSGVIPAARAHGVSRFIYQCPLTEHAHAQPRGYPGDAGLLDLIYRHPSADSTIRDATPLGRDIFEMTVAVPACESVRERREVVAGKIDTVAASRPDADMLSVACGNLREAELSEALQNDALRSFVALDQDPLSLASVEAYALACGRRVHPKQATIRDLLCDRHSLGRFDFVYSTGLYDYLQAPTAARLTRKLFDLLKSDGTLLVANFLNGIWEAPYMEAFMDWHLNYRDERQIRAFLSEIEPAQIASTSYWTDASACIGYLEVIRR